MVSLPCKSRSRNYVTVWTRQKSGYSERGSAWNARHEPYAHEAAALQAGLTPQQIAALISAKGSKGLNNDEVAGQHFTRQLVFEPEVDDAAEKQAF